VGFILAVTCAVFAHIARGLHLSQRRAACGGSLTQKASLSQTQDSPLEPQSMISMNRGTGMLVRAIKRLDQETDEILFTQLHLVLAAKSNITMIHF